MGNRCLEAPHHSQAEASQERLRLVKRLDDIKLLCLLGEVPVGVWLGGIGWGTATN